MNLEALIAALQAIERNHPYADVKIYIENDEKNSSRDFPVERITYDHLSRTILIKP